MTGDPVIKRAFLTIYCLFSYDVFGRFHFGHPSLDHEGRLIDAMLRAATSQSVALSSIGEYFGEVPPFWKCRTREARIESIRICICRPGTTMQNPAPTPEFATDYIVR
jgi:hypothetical protein